MRVQEVDPVGGDQQNGQKSRRKDVDGKFIKPWLERSCFSSISSLKGVFDSDPTFLWSILQIISYTWEIK